MSDLERFPAPDAEAHDSTLTAILAKLERLEQRVAEQDAQLAGLSEAPSASVEPTPLETLSSRSSRRSMLGRVAAFAALGAVALSAASQTAHANDGKPKKRLLPMPPSGPKPASKAPNVNELIMGTTNLAPGAGAGTETTIENATLDWLDKFVFQSSQNTGVSTVNTLVRNALYNSYPGLNEPVSALIGSTNVAASNSGGRQAYGTVGYSSDGVGVVGAGLWPVQVAAQSGLPATVDSANQGAPYGVLYYQSATLDTLWANMYGTFRRISMENMLGVLQPTGQPVRVLDTRAGSLAGFDSNGNAILAGAIAAGAVVGFRVAGKTFGSFTFPADTRGIFGTLFLVDSGATGGFVTISGINPPSSTAATITPNGASPFVASSSALTQLDANGNFWVRNVGAARNIGFDVAGYYL